MQSIEHNLARIQNKLETTQQRAQYNTQSNSIQHNYTQLHNTRKCKKFIET